jgi:hypothetical protein
MSLHLVDSPPPTPPAFELAPIDLRRQLTRPGVTHTEVELQVGVELAEAASRVAIEEGLSIPVWIGFVVESERAVEQACSDKREIDELRGCLDRMARASSPPIPGGATRLAEFGKALRNVGETPPQRSAARLDLRTAAKISARVPYQVVTAWRLAAIESGQPVDAWAIDHLRRLPRGRFRWEAAAAERGETLAEWVLVQAARR